MLLIVSGVIFLVLAAVALAFGRYLGNKRHEVAERQYAAIVREHQRRT